METKGKEKDTDTPDREDQRNSKTINKVQIEDTVSELFPCVWIKILQYYYYVVGKRFWVKRCHVIL